MLLHVVVLESISFTSCLKSSIGTVTLKATYVKLSFWKVFDLRDMDL